MSRSSKTLKEHELPDLRAAQLQAAELHRLDWVKWMRATYTYAKAVRMSRHLGFPVPNLLFYQRMREAGKLLKQLPKPAPIIPLHWGLLQDIDLLG